jgi:hypothetical protein
MGRIEKLIATVREDEEVPFSAFTPEERELIVAALRLAEAEDADGEVVMRTLDAYRAAREAAR